MNTDNESYDPATDENQGVLTTLIQADEASHGVAQVDRMDPHPTAQGPEPIKEEVNDEEASNGVNDDMLEEEDVEAGNVDADDN